MTMTFSAQKKQVLAEVKAAFPAYKSLTKARSTQGCINIESTYSRGMNRCSTLRIVCRTNPAGTEYTISFAGFGTRAPYSSHGTGASLAAALLALKFNLTPNDRRTVDLYNLL